MRRRGGCNFSLPLRNLSTHGCKVELIELVQVEEDVIARFPGLEPLGATVCWVEDDAAGLSFRKPLHPAVFDLLVARLTASAADKRRGFRCGS